ncbi:hypothetical protein GPECTOR_81g187 [Gonium pectorale]|uniref:BTB domain-containing protein n=1 Tax=Gonium pectorale TaxID=33097 RepID=A0A150G1J1_GONPE|nr:hypothetical protein GPECTOR_81g187 [Gonium pectorale]|eukprot:KXZ43739.1 hypothetical protein GPECTOR_81g187 [Gonium pectorale]
MYASRKRAQAERQPYSSPYSGFDGGCYDAFTGDIFLIEGSSVVRLLHDGTVVPVAGGCPPSGACIDGRGAKAGFASPHHLTSDHKGAVYVADKFRIRKMELPACWRSGGLPRGSRKPAAAPEVTTLHTAESDILGLAYNSVTERLHFITGVSVRTLSLPAQDSASASSGAAAQVVHDIRLDAVSVEVGEVGCGGSDDDESSGDGSDGMGDEQQGDGHLPLSSSSDDDDEDDDEEEGEHDIAGNLLTTGMGLTVDGNGNAYTVLRHGDSYEAVRVLTPEGRLHTVTDRLPTLTAKPHDVLGVLPNGCLALTSGRSLLLLGLGLKPPALSAPAPAGPRQPSLSTDLGALLDRQPDGTADLVVRVEGRRFHVHRGILAARSEYFRTQLAAGFADGSAPEIELHEASADAFAILLRYMYTGAVELPPQEAVPVAELADRLLLPALCLEAQALLLASVDASNVVERVLWADSRGEVFAGLLGQLKAWLLEHHDEVAVQGRDGLKRLAAANPDLMVELYVAPKRSRR